ncbi:hypothetical protein GGTG_05091 [Gaeumannomyces tritici R3-111a-1]|uniref:Uncharacterized protein n=1 Tax=Gaeumannomyces tritici (strain R3-111a-1) TaxID=644352 RepID=J3NUY2_GAET3|nr:hypothetical protein GGTG_05091 [Gaeumannomyces tritici R3-111a-1]EJT75154.1 hypothetical protein GGTG_05091 [Gaeumannomyces tritici R3-111a-1]
MPSPTSSVDDSSAYPQTGTCPRQEPRNEPSSKQQPFLRANLYLPCWGSVSAAGLRCGESGLSGVSALCCVVPLAPTD